MKRLSYTTLISLAFTLFIYSKTFAEIPIIETTKQTISSEYYLSANQKNMIFQEKIPPFKEVWGYGEVNDITYSPDLNWFAIATTLGIELYNRVTGKLEKHFISKGKVNSIDFSPDSRFLALGQDNGQLILWNLKDFSFKFFDQKIEAIQSVKYSSHGLLAIKINEEINTHSGKLNTFTENSKWFVSGGIEYFIRLYSFKNKETQKLYLHNSPLIKLVIAPDTDILFSVDVDGVVYQTDMSTKKAHALFQTRKSIKNMALSPDGLEISLVLSNNSVLLISIPSLSVEVLAQHLPTILTADSLEKGEIAITGHDDGSLAFWINKEKKTIIKNEHHAWVNTVSVHINNRYLFSGDGMGKLIMWDLRTYRSKKSFSFKKAIIGITPITKNKIMVITPVTVYILTLSTGKKRVIKQFKRTISAFAYNKKDKLLSISFSTGGILILDSKGQVKKRIPNNKRIVSMRWGSGRNQLILTFEDQSSALISLNKPYSRKEIGYLSAGILHFDEENETALIWSSKGVLVMAKPTNEYWKKSDTIQSLGEKDNKLLIEKLENRILKKTLSIQERAKAHLRLAMLYTAEGNDKKAISHFQKALLYFRQLKNWGKLWKIYNNMGVINIYRDNLSKAIKLFKGGLKIKNHPVLLYNLGVTYNRWQKPKKSYFYYLKALKRAKKTKNLKARSHILYVLAKYHYRKKDFKRAKSYANKSLALSRKINPSLAKKSLTLLKRIRK